MNILQDNSGTTPEAAPGRPPRKGKFPLMIATLLAVAGVRGSARAEEQERLEPGKNSVGAGVALKINPAKGESRLGPYVDYAREMTHDLALKTSASWHTLREEDKSGSAFSLACGPVIDVRLSNSLEAGFAAKAGVEMEIIGGKTLAHPLAALCAELGADVTKRIEVVLGLCGEETFAPRRSTAVTEGAVRFRF